MQGDMVMGRCYSVGQFARLTGVSVRTLHHYEEQGLLFPQRSANGYRIYGEDEEDRLQQVLLYREMGLRLADIRKILDDPSFDQRDALVRHLEELQAREVRIERLIASVKRTLQSLEGGAPMDTEEKFEAFKQDLVEKNERKYGKEVRERWGDEVVDASNEKMRGLSQTEWQRGTEIEAELKTELIAALEEGDAAGAHARRAAELHAEGLRLFWPEGLYAPETHRALAHSYLADERFKAYYDAWMPGATEMLVKAIDNLYDE